MRSITSDKSCLSSDNNSTVKSSANTTPPKPILQIFKEALNSHYNLEQNDMLSASAKAVGLQSSITSESECKTTHQKNTALDACSFAKSIIKEKSLEVKALDNSTTVPLVKNKESSKNTEICNNHLDILTDKNALLNFFSSYSDDLKTYFILNNLLTNPENKDKVSEITLPNIHDAILDRSISSSTRTNLVNFMQSILLNYSWGTEIQFNALNKLEQLLENNGSFFTAEEYLEITDCFYSILINPKIHILFKKKVEAMLTSPKIDFDIKANSLNILSEKNKCSSLSDTYVRLAKSDFIDIVVMLITHICHTHIKINGLDNIESAEINDAMSSLNFLSLNEKIDVLDAIIYEIRSYNFFKNFAVSLNFAKYIIVLKNIKKSVVEEQKLIEELELHKSFQGFNKKNIWQLFINKREHKTRQKYGYENESGYLAGCFCGFRHMLEYIRERGSLDSETFNIDTLNEWRYHTVKGTLKEDFRSFKIALSTNYEFYLNHYNLSEAGKKELTANATKKTEVIYRLKDNVIKKFTEHSYVNELYKMYELFTIEDNPKLSFTGCKSNFNTVVDLKAAMNKVLQKLFQELNIAESECDKEKVMLKSVITLNRMHGFADGNVRTLFFIFLNGLMISNGLSPLIWLDPNLSDGHSFDESYELLCAAKRNFQECIIH